MFAGKLVWLCCYRLWPLLYPLFTDDAAQLEIVMPFGLAGLCLLGPWLYGQALDDLRERRGACQAALENGVLRLALEPEATALVPALACLLASPLLARPGTEGGLSERLRRLLANYGRCVRAAGLLPPRPGWGPSSVACSGLLAGGVLWLTGRETWPLQLGVLLAGLR